MPPALLDTNVLVNAAFRDAPHHASAARLLAQGLRRRGVYCIAPQNLVEFAAVATRPRLVSDPMPAADLLRMTEILFASQRLTKIYPRRGTVHRALRQGTDLGFTGPRWYDMFLAVTMLDAGIQRIVTDDLGTFGRIPFVTPIGIEDAAS